MLRRYDVFVVRHWGVESGERIIVEHVQSRHRVLVRSLEAAVEWIDARCRAPTNTPLVAPDGNGSESSTEEKGGVMPDGGT